MIPHRAAGGKAALALVAGLGVTMAGASEAAAQPSFAPLKTCPTGTILVPAGAFPMGKAPGTRIDLDGFCIDRLPVSNADYKAFITAAKYYPPESNLIKSSGLRDPDLWKGNEFPRQIAAQPVVNVSWISAQSYCHWHGKRLPTEAEWEKAARGVDGRLYPWGNTPPDASKAWFGQKWRSTETLKPVGSFAKSASPYGVEDMAGNVWQWTSTIDRSGPYVESDGRENVGSPGERIVRGGAWYSLAEQLQSTYRWSFPPHGAEPVIGFRCGRGLSGEANPYTTPDKLFSLGVPSFWSIVERYRVYPGAKDKRLFDMIGFVHGNLDITITVRSVPSEGDSVQEFVDDYIESGAGKPYNRTFLRYDDQVYYSVDRPVGKILDKTELTVGGEKAISLSFAPSLAPGLDMPPIDDRAKVKEVAVRRGKDIYLFTLNGVEGEFARDERLFDEVIGSIHWLH